MYAQHAEAATGRRQRALHRLDAAKAHRLEKALVRHYDLTTACSLEDATAIGPGVVVVPNGVELDLPLTPVPAAPRILLPGTLNFAPNVDGALWFTDAVLPLVRAERPDVSLQVVGRDPDPSVLALDERPEVEVHADVPSMEPFVRDARVIVVPLRVGTGTRLKALEGLAARRPVAGTVIGLEGLGLTDGVDAMVADDPPALATRIVRLLDDDALAARMGAAGRALVEERFGWERIGPRFAAEVLQRTHQPETP
jgi:hypothetical protein